MAAVKSCHSTGPANSLALDFTIALAGNPNAGKSTIFNALTGSHQHVGNWPGKTVEKKEGKLTAGGKDIAIVDLPGTYSLTAFSMEELIARDFLIDSHPDAVIAVVDATNLERNLYLVIQLIETGLPVIIALNMSDIASQRGIQIDPDQLSKKLFNMPVIPTVGYRQHGLDKLRRAIEPVISTRTTSKIITHFDPVIETEIQSLQAFIDNDVELAGYSSRWLAIKLLENDETIFERVRHNTPMVEAARYAIHTITETTGDEPDTWIADGRYGFIESIAKDVIRRPVDSQISVSDRLDRILTHRIWGVPIFLFFMWLVFQFTANVSAPYLDWIDGVVSGPFTNWSFSLMTLLGLSGSWIEALLVDGIIAGVGGVLVFVPVLFSLYFAIAIMEDSGYMARAAFVMDRFMSALGLHGKSFLPLLVGFGCTVPAIYATRTLDNHTDRKITAFLATFMSCGARLPVYMIFGAAFFGSASGNLVFAMYLTGIGVAILTSLVMTRLIYRDKPVPPFVMELPPYRVPNARTVAITVRERSMAFIRKAGTIILIASIIIWLLMAIPLTGGGFNDVEPEQSAFGTLSKVSAPVFAPAGFGDWESTGALVTGFVAKEVIISTLTQTYVGAEQSTEPTGTNVVDNTVEIGRSLGEATVLTLQAVVNIVPRTVNLIPGVSIPEAALVSVDASGSDDARLETALSRNFTPLSALAFNVFILLYVPCMSATAAMRHEFGAGWMWKQVAYTFAVAWLSAVLVFQIGGLL
ncbi:MAG: ferrous iron transport protein B [Chloroflexi bacterium]|nr:ferrous iron transport protein B [Chloroflexota bacterium]